jgi:hypothetical protein
MVAAVVLLLVLGVVAYRRGGVLDLPPVPGGLTLENTGLGNIGALRERARALDSMISGAATDGRARGGDASLTKAAEGIVMVRRGEGEAGLRMVREALSEQPGDLVLGNAYRMAVLSLRHAALVNDENRETLAEHLPSYLEGESVATLERLNREHPSREAAFQLSVAWIDEVVLSPKPEGRLPASVANMKLLDEILAKDPYYLPAICSRGLGYLNLPARIDIIPAWKESLRPSPNAASRELGRCVAIGRTVGAGSPELAGSQAMNLGDAYAKEGRPDRARSWWQLAQNASRDRSLQEAIQRRFAWRDEELIDQLEAERNAAVQDVDHPVTDLSSIWR